MRLPAWLDPLWHVDYDLESSLPTDAVDAALRSGKGSLRAYSSRVGAVVLVRRGIFGRYVLARVRMRPAGTGTTVTVRISRPTLAEALLVLAFFGLVAYEFVGVLFYTLFDRARMFDSVVFFLIGTAIWASVTGSSYASARKEARALQRLIDQALQLPS